MKAKTTVEPPPVPRKKPGARLPNPAVPPRKHTVPRLHGVAADTDGRVRTGPMSADDRKLVGAKLRAMRVSRGWKIEDVAAKLGCTVNTVAATERGEWHVSVALLDRWLLLLGIDLLAALGMRP